MLKVVVSETLACAVFRVNVVQCVKLVVQNDGRVFFAYLILYVRSDGINWPGGCTVYTSQCLLGVFFGYAVLF